MSKTIDIVVAPNGQTRVETRGFAGTECQQASEFIEKALGRRADEQLTAEFHQIDTTRHRQEQRNG